MDEIRVIHGMAIRDAVPGYCCPFCKEPVGYVGRFFAWVFGTRFHGCNFSNVMHPQEYEMKAAALSTPLASEGGTDAASD